jgi:purine operon repressor
MLFKRKERIGAIIKILADNPNKIFRLQHFTEKFDSAKSTISEDIDIIRGIIDKLGMGKIITIVGASGGVKYAPFLEKSKMMELLDDIVSKLNEPDRLIPGGLIYALDILYNPNYLKKIAKIFSSYFYDQKIDYVLTVETKGIPLATMTAEVLNVPLIIVRDENKLTEGATIGINYASGSTGILKTMFVSKKSIRKGSNILLVDDFLRCGGTSHGMKNIVKELESVVVGMCFLIEIDSGKKKMIDDYVSLIKIYKANDGKQKAYINDETLKKI